MAADNDKNVKKELVMTQKKLNSLQKDMERIKSRSKAEEQKQAKKLAQ